MNIANSKYCVYYKLYFHSHLFFILHHCNTNYDLNFSENGEQFFYVVENAKTMFFLYTYIVSKTSNLMLLLKGLEIFINGINNMFCQQECIPYESGDSYLSFIS